MTIQGAVSTDPLLMAAFQLCRGPMSRFLLFPVEDQSLRHASEAWSALPPQPPFPPPPHLLLKLLFFRFRTGGCWPRAFAKFSPVRTGG